MNCQPLNLLRLGLLAPLTTFGGQEPEARKGGAIRPLKHEEFLVMPLRVHILSSNELAEIDCHLSDGDITRIVKKANRVWHQSGIHWGLERVLREPVARTDRFLRARDLRGEELLDAAEVKAARDEARSLPDAAPAAVVRQMAEAALAAGDETRARRLWSWLADLPGGDNARKRLESL